MPNLLRWAGRITHLSGMSISSYTKALVEHFQKKTEDMVDEFKDTKKTHDDLLIVRNDANKIDKVLSGTFG
jgi:hypothetical protein